MKKYYSEALMVTHQMAESLHRIGAIDDVEMGEFDDDCLIPDTEIDMKISIGHKKKPVPAGA
jgi:DNA-binding transcriptional regulator YiaG